MNRNNVRDFTTGDTKRLILAFFLPMLLTNSLQQIYTFVDTFIVGKGLGDNSLAAVGNMGSLFFFIVGFSLGLSNGFGIVIAQSYGAKDFARLRRNVAATIQLAVLITIILSIVSVSLLPAALKLLKTDSIIIEDCLKYGYIIFGGLFSSIMYNISACILRSLGDSRTPLNAIVISSVTNVILDCLFIFVLRTGVEGAAIATVISQVLSAAVCIRKLSKIDFLKLGRNDFKVDMSLWWTMLRNGIPMACMNSITATGCMVVQSFVNGLGVDYTSAYSVCSKYINLFMNPAFTSGQAISSFAGQNYGAGKYDRINEGLRVCLAISMFFYITLGSVMVFASHQLADLLLDGEIPIMLAESYLPIAGMMLISVDFLFVYRSAAQGMGFPVIPMISGIAEMTLRIVVIITFINRFGFAATALAEAAAWTGALLVNMVAYYIHLPRDRQDFIKKHNITVKKVF